MTVTTAIQCPDTVQRTHPQGFDRTIMVVGTALTEWAGRRADLKAMRRRRSPLAGLTDSEQAELRREATAVREAAQAQRAYWHVIG